MFSVLCDGFAVRMMSKEPNAASGKPLGSSMCELVTFVAFSLYSQEEEVIHPSLRSLSAIVFGVCVTVAGRTASAAPNDFAHVPTTVAQDATPAPATMESAPAAEATAQPKVIQLHGEGDLGYTRVPVNGTLKFINGNSTRFFDTLPNTPNVQNIYLGATLNTKVVGGEFDFSFGSDANALTPYANATNQSWDFTQAFLTHDFADHAQIKVGRSKALAGYEDLEAAKDYNYSRSILFTYAVPKTETGAWLSWCGKKLHASFGETLGWDKLRQPTDVNGVKDYQRTSELALVYKPTNSFKWKVDGMVGREPILVRPTAAINGTPFGAQYGIVLTPGQLAANPVWSVSPNSGIRSLYDTVISGNVTKKLELVGNYDYGMQQNAVLVNGPGVVTAVGTARWQGVALYANYAFTNKWSGTVRAESLRDFGGYLTGFDQKWVEQTITAQYDPVSALALRLEYRNDNSNQPVFARGGGASGATFQHTWGAEAIAKF